jgi:hypothetical protein
MSVSLTKEISASKEAYFSWEITDINFLKGMLYLTDIAQEGDSDSAVLKYQLHSTESPVGSHMFEDLTPGEYYAELTIIDKNNVMYTSEQSIFFVYEVGGASINTVSPLNEGFNITLDAYDNSSLLNGQNIETVNFILFGRQKKISGGVLSFVQGTSNKLNIIVPYSSSNIYRLTNYGIKNSWYYEIACFYTDNKTVSGEISNTKVSTPTNTPNKITNVSANYDYSNKRLLINYTNPDDADEWFAKTVRATITYGSTVRQYFFTETSPNFALLGQQIVFNQLIFPLLPVDTLFKITLCMEAKDIGYGDYESVAIECMVPTRFCSEPTAIYNEQYIVGDNAFSMTFNKLVLDKYNVSVQMTLTHTTHTCVPLVIDDYQSGQNVTLNNGDKYNVNLQVFYTNKTDASIVFGPCIADVPVFDYDFIPHGQADAPSNLLVTYGDGTAELTWDEPASFHGYILDYYELSYDNFTTTIPTGSNRSLTISCENGYNSGNVYHFKVRAVTKSADISFYNGAERTQGKQSSIDVYPLKKPQKPILDTKTPGDARSTITFHDANLHGGVKKEYTYTITNAVSGSILSNSTTKIFDGLTNGVTSTISVKVVTTSGTNTQESEPLIFSTTPFKMPDVPILSAVPYEDNVVLSWPSNNPTSILDKDVQYDVEYKLSTDSNWNTSNANKSSPLTISGLDSDKLYNFRIRSKIYNDENSDTKYSDYNTLSSRPFKYKNMPTMELTAGTNSVTVKLTPPVSPNANFYNAQTYYATIALNSSPSEIISNISSTDSTLYFNIANSSGLVNLSNYVVTGYYDTLNTETNTSYTSNTVSNQVVPFDPTVAPPLTCTPDNDKIKLSWNDVNMYGLTITKYQVSSKLATDSSWSNFVDTAPAHSDSGEPNKTNYNIEITQSNGVSKSYKIRAVIDNANQIYYSAESNVVTVTPFKKAGIPLLNSYISSDKKITLNWLQPEELGGLPLLRYEVKKNSDTNWFPVGKVLSYDFTGLNNGTVYTFSVQAITDNSVNADNLDYVNEIVGSEQLNQSAIPYAEPTIYLNAVVSLDSSLKLNWTQDLGGHIFDHYKIYYNASSDDNITTTDLNYTIISLNNGTTYDCKVEVYVKDDNANAPTLLVSKISNIKSNIPYKPADSPKNITSVPNNGFVVVNWESADLNGLQLKRYEVAYKVKDSSNNLVWYSANTNLSYEVADLVNGFEYEFKVRAVTTNSYHSSDPNKNDTDEVIGADASTFNIPYLPLEAPLIANCEAQNKSVTLSWNQPTLTGLELDHYEVSGGALLEPVNVAKLTTYIFTDLINNTEYSFYVKAVATHKYAGTITSNNSQEVSKIPFTRPDSVTGLVCRAVNNVLTITFNSSSTSSVNNGLAQDYKYKIYGLNQTRDSVDYNSISSGATLDISAYGDNTFTLDVYARVRDPNNSNNDTNSVYSLPNSINLVDSNLASGIQNLSAISGDNQITLNWENVETGSIYYVDWVKPDGSVVNVATVTQLTTTITALENGTSYKYNVYASKDDMLQISATPIGKPIIISVVATNNYTFTTNINLNGDSKVYIMIIAVTSTGNLEVLGNKYFTAQSNTIVGTSTVTYTRWVTVAVNNAGSITFPLAGTGTNTLQENIG